MEIDNTKHFMNACRCTVHGPHGYSCAVDSLMEIFHYGIFRHIADVEKHKLHHPLVVRIIHVSDLRMYMNPDCDMREEVWNWLVDNLPSAFMPKGRDDAIVIEAFACLANGHTGKLFNSTFSGTLHCPVCDNTSPITASAGPVYDYLQDINKQWPGQFSKVLEVAIQQGLQEEYTTKCKTCLVNLQVEKSSEKLTMSNFLIVHIGILNGKNVMKPPVVVPEETVVNGICYTLTSAVCVRPGHFYCIVKDGDSFVVIDDLHKEKICYTTFGAAVNRDPRLSSRCISLSERNGVYILIYSDHVANLPGLAPIIENTETTQHDTSHVIKDLTNLPSMHINSEGNNNTSVHVAHESKRESTSLLELTSSADNGHCDISDVATSDLHRLTPVNMHTRTPSNSDQSESFTGKNRKSMPNESALGPLYSPILSRHYDDSVFEPIVEAHSSFNPKQHSTPVVANKRSNISNTANRKLTQKMKINQRNDNLQSEICIGREFSDDEVDWKVSKICGHDVKAIHLYDGDYFECKSVFVAANIYSVIENRGFTKIDNMLCHANGANGISLRDSFLCKGRNRIWVRKDALIVILKSESSASRQNTAADSVKQAVLKFRFKRARSSSVKSDTDQSIQSDLSKSTSNTTNTKCITAPVNIDVDGISVTFCIRGDVLYVNTNEIFSVMGLSKHIAKQGFVCIDRYLQAGGIVDPTTCFVMDGKKRPYFKTDSVNALMTNLPTQIMTVSCKYKFILAFSQALGSLAVNKYKSSSAPVKTKTSDSACAVHRLIGDHFNGDKKAFLNLVSDKILNADDIKYIIERTRNKSKKGAKNMKKCVKEVYRGMFPMLPEDLINIQENVSGVQLTNEMRKKLAGVIPTRIQEMEVKHKMSKEFMSVMLPRRTSTGWTINATRLLEVLQFKYPFLEGTIFAKLQGDGRLVGGRHSTYIGLNLLNDDLKLRGISYQNPKEIYPISVFYESDSRDNLEKNIGEQNALQDMISSAGADVKFFLGGDEMFLEAMLDGSNILGPTTNTGWNIYHECDHDQKKAVASTGFRTDMNMPLDRKHTESLLSSIPIERTVFCILHGLARIVEKLIMLEVEGIISTANKAAQTRCGMTAEDLVHNLESNINTRGVRQGNFHVPFDKNGKPEKISLNKDHALAIISPPPVGTEKKFPHVLINVVPTTVMANNLPLKVKEYLKIEHDFSELECVQMIWESVYEMFTIMQKEPAHTLKDIALEGSIKPCDYSFSYSDELKRTYKFHAERLFQLFTVKYTYKNLTPYILKFVDYGLHFMKNLGIPLCRFSTEGGEHSNYNHNCFYYQHTTRNGGQNIEHDPNFAILLASWRSLYYDITKGDIDAAAAFQCYIQKHVWASQLQRKFRKHMFRATCKKIGLVAPISALDRDVQNEKLVQLEAIVSQRMQVHQVKGLLQGQSYILCGNVPKYSGRKMTHQCVADIIKEHGGRVKKNMPGCSKGRSAKQYILLVNLKQGAKIPKVVTDAIRRGYNVVNYRFLYESVDKQALQELPQYLPPILGSISRSINRMPSLFHKHFKKRAKMVTLLKKRRKLRSNTEKQVNAPRNLAIFYAIVKRREFSKKKKVSFATSGKLLGKFSKEYKQLPQLERRRYFAMWQNLKQRQKDQRKKADRLVTYNSTENPNYSKVVTSLNHNSSEI